MNPDLASLINFMKLTHEIRNVRRSIVFETDLRKENDSEHMYQLALTAWFLIEKDKLKLDKNKAVAMALVHDIVEIYSGDTSVYQTERSDSAKAINERLAATRLKKEWPQFKSLHELIQDYKERLSPEAKFIYSLDKLIPMINNYLYGGRSWREQGINLEMVKKVKTGKVNQSPEINAYYQQMLKLLESNPKLFGVRK